MVFTLIHLFPNIKNVLIDVKIVMEMEMKKIIIALNVNIIICIPMVPYTLTFMN